MIEFNLREEEGEGGGGQGLSLFVEREEGFSVWNGEEGGGRWTS